jgi:hypothetical protein
LFYKLITFALGIVAASFFEKKDIAKSPTACGNAQISIKKKEDTL